MLSLFEFVRDRWDTLLELSVEHVEVVVVSVGLAAVLGCGLALLVHGRPRGRAVVLGVTSSVLTIPSFALFGLLIPVLGLGYPPTVTALTAYALLPVVRNGIAGLDGVEPAALKAARAMGMTRLQRLLRVELPVAWPVVLTGLRLSTVLTVSGAAIAAYVNGPGLGEPIFTGLNRIGGANSVNLVLSAVLAVVVVALLLDALFVLLHRCTTPRGLRTGTRRAQVTAS